MTLSNYNPKYFSNTPLQAAFLKDVKRYQVLKPEEERELISKYQTERDMTARDRLILSNQLFVYSCAKRYAKDEDEIMDYVQEGNIGLSIAIDNFRPEEGKKLMTVGVLYIRRSMNFYLNNVRDTVHRPNAVKLGSKIERMKQRFYVENGYLPTDETLMEMANDTYDLGLTDINDVRDIRISSISEEIKEDYTVEDNTEYNEYTSVENEFEDNVEKENAHAQVIEALGMLPDKTKDIIMKLFGIGYKKPYSMDEVCYEYHMDAPTVSQIRNRGIEYLRQNYKIRMAI